MLDVLEGRTSMRGVKEIKTLDITEEAKKALSTPLNYSVTWNIMTPSDYGIPQRRERLFIVGFDRDNFLPEDIDISDILRWPSKWGNDTRVGSILDHKLSPEDKKKCTISERLWISHQDRKKRNKENGKGFGYSLYQPEDKKTGTISARYYKDGAEILISNGRNKNGIEKPPRKLTPRECARLQGFPEDFKLSDSRNESYKQFGNAVNVRVVRLLADSVISAMKEISDLKTFKEKGLVTSEKNQISLKI